MPRALPALISLLIITAPIAGVTAVSASVDSNDHQHFQTEEPDIAGNFSTAADNVTIYDRSVQTLRVDRSSTVATAVEFPRTEVSSPAVSVPTQLRSAGNRQLVTLAAGSSPRVELNLNATGGGNVDDKQVHLIAARITEPVDSSLSSLGDFSEFGAFVRGEYNTKVEFTNYSSESITNNNAAFNYDNAEPGEYIFFSVLGNGIHVEDGDISVEERVFVIGADTVFVQESPSQIVTESETPEVGDTVRFNVEAPVTTADDNVEHVVALFNESVIGEQEITIKAPAEIKQSTTASSFTVTSDIKEASGETALEEGTSAFGRELDTTYEKIGIFDLPDVVTYLAAGGKFSEQENPGTTILNASVTAVTAGPDATVTVDTQESFEPGSYVAVHLAMVDGDLTTIAASRTDLSLIPPTADTDPTPSDGGGGGGGGGGFALVTPETAPDVEVTTTESTIPTLDTQNNQRVAEFDQVQSVNSVTFDTPDRIGEVFVSDVDVASSNINPPGAPITANDIAVPETTTDRPAVIEFNVPRERLSVIGATAEDLRVFHRQGDQYDSLPTTVSSTTEETVTVTAEATEFSVFVVSAVGQPTAQITTNADEIQVGEQLELSAAETTVPFGEIETVEWDIAGESIMGGNITTTVDQSGPTTVSVAVTTRAGVTDTTTTTITIAESETEIQTVPDDSNRTEPSPAEETDDETPGFGPLAALLAILLTAGAAVRQG